MQRLRPMLQPTHTTLQSSTYNPVLCGSDECNNAAYTLCNGTSSQHTKVSLRLRIIIGIGLFDFSSFSYCVSAKPVSMAKCVLVQQP
ncbi:hypothetical protein QYF36_007984 [Acer negundo]|nr:hypothetical protein QYF36_007984 [Acer negundo]